LKGVKERMGRVDEGYTERVRGVNGDVERVER